MKRCVMIKILENKGNRNCKQLTKNAFSSEQFCYIDKGFCNHILLDDENLSYLASKVFNSSDSWNDQAIQQVCI